MGTLFLLLALLGCKNNKCEDTDDTDDEVGCGLTWQVDEVWIDTDDEDTAVDLAERE